MPGFYTIKQGDFLTKIAVKNGFVDPMTIWHDPHNTSLAHKRKSPNILLPGDQLFIPDKTLKTLDRGTSQLHKFVLRRNQVEVKIVLNNTDFEPIANASYILNLGQKSVAADSDGKGLIDQEVDATNSEVGTLTLSQTDGQFDIELGIKLGFLNPIDTASGQMARLNNLGYFAGKSETGDLMDKKQPIADEEQARFNSAVEEFQCDHMAPGSVDGKCGPLTQAALEKLYGC